MTTRLMIEPNTVFGRLTVISYSYDRVSCVCSCGNFCVVSDQRLLDGGTKSCGCLNRQLQHSRFHHMNNVLKKQHQYFVEKKD
ncbi:MAG: hypothetical protein JHC33_07180 [Ignisphaera sp.]|nr:hypothetical protein [Ignisphaera sp.]